MNLKKYHTFGFDVFAPKILKVNNIVELKRALIIDSSPIILGGGSNTIFTSPPKSLVIKNQIIYQKTLKNNKNFCLVEFGSGVVWDQVCAWATKNNLYGIENLSLIPGTIGAAPIQNIGAYGQELSTSFYSLKYLDLKTKKIVTLKKADCNFGYRDSIFKNQLKNKAFILSVTLKLAKNGTLNISYPDLKKELENKTISLDLVRKTITSIRKSKLPDPKKIGNSGSFFKNPIISKNILDHILALHPEVPNYPQDDTTYKIPAAFLLDKAGFKDRSYSGVGVHPKQPLVLVNLGGQPHQLLDLVDQIQKTILEKYKVHLEPEVNIL